MKDFFIFEPVRGVLQSVLREMVANMETLEEMVINTRIPFCCFLFCAPYHQRIAKTKDETHKTWCNIGMIHSFSGHCFINLISHLLSVQEKRLLEHVHFHDLSSLLSWFHLKRIQQSLIISIYEKILYSDESLVFLCYIQYHFICCCTKNLQNSK